MQSIGFVTEKQIEAWLERETRNLPMPNGPCRSLTAFNLTWEKLDDLVELAGYTPARLVDFAIEESLLQKAPLEKTFPYCVAYLYDHLDVLIVKKKRRDNFKATAVKITGKAKTAFNRASH